MQTMDIKAATCGVCLTGSASYDTVITSIVTRISLTDKKLCCVLMLLFEF